MEWLQFLITILTIASFLWMARSDYRHLDTKIDAISKEMNDFRDKWALETKDFHGRLEKQDAEFKAFMKAEEQKRTQILMNR